MENTQFSVTVEKDEQGFENSLSLAKAIYKVLDHKNGEDLAVMRVGDKIDLTDYFVLCTAQSNTHVNALTDEVEYQLEKIEIKDDDTEEVKFQKEAVMVLREELRKYIKDGSTVADFIRDVQRRQQMEAEHVREARGMIMESLAKDDPAQARELYDAINKHMNEKGLPKVRIARKFLKMMEVEE